VNIHKVNMAFNIYNEEPSFYHINFLAIIFIETNNPIFLLIHLSQKSFFYTGYLGTMYEDTHETIEWIEINKKILYYLFGIFCAIINKILIFKIDQMREAIAPHEL